MSESVSELTCTAGPDDDGARADVVLSRHHLQLSRRVAKQLALAGHLRVAGQRAKPSHRVSVGERLVLRVPESQHTPFALELLRETDAFIYVAKPTGVHTVALRPDEAGCLATAVAHAFPETRQASEDPRESGAVHRLDHATSGVVAFAKTRDAWLAARRLFDRREVHKDYMARSDGAWPPSLPSAPTPSLPSWLEPYEAAPAIDGLELVSDDTLRIRAPLGRGEERRSVTVRLDGQRATTLAQRVRSQTRLCLRLRLVTGLRHQARVHLAWAGLPIDGDPLYAGAPAPRLMLHAYQLDLSAGFDGESPVRAEPDPSFFA